MSVCLSFGLAFEDRKMFYGPKCDSKSGYYMMVYKYLWFVLPFIHSSFSMGQKIFLSIISKWY